jgi:hypothetical protein
MFNVKRRYFIFDRLKSWYLIVHGHLILLFHIFDALSPPQRRDWNRLTWILHEAYMNLTWSFDWGVERARGATGRRKKELHESYMRLTWILHEVSIGESIPIETSCKPIPIHVSLFQSKLHVSLFQLPLRRREFDACHHIFCPSKRLFGKG